MTKIEMKISFLSWSDSEFFFFPSLYVLSRLVLDRWSQKIWKNEEDRTSEMLYVQSMRSIHAKEKTCFLYFIQFGRLDCRHVFVCVCASVGTRCTLLTTSLHSTVRSLLNKKIKCKMDILLLFNIHTNSYIVFVCLRVRGKRSNKKWINKLLTHGKEF